MLTKPLRQQNQRFRLLRHSISKLEGLLGHIDDREVARRSTCSSTLVHDPFQSAQATDSFSSSSVEHTEAFHLGRTDFTHLHDTQGPFRLGPGVENKGLLKLLRLLNHEDLSTAKTFSTL